jgi:NADPH:quinone reductase-like Zn-dependent oxidoreductase
MKAIQLERFGIGHLQLKEIPIPVMGENEVLVKTTAVSLEFHDLIVVENRIPFGVQLPHIPVSEGVGVVESVLLFRLFPVGRQEKILLTRTS